MTLLEFFTGFITVFDNPFWDWVFGGLLMSVSGSIAYAIGGRLGYRGKIGFVLWLITAVAVYALFACIIRFIMWLISIPWWVWLIVCSVVLAIIITVIVIAKKGEKHE